MAIITLPNGSKMNTSLDIYNQPHTNEYSGSLDFCEEVMQNNDISSSFIPGPNSNIPKRNTQTFVDTSYDTYNYKIITSFIYKQPNEYSIHATETKLIRENK